MEIKLKTAEDLRNLLVGKQIKDATTRIEDFYCGKVFVIDKLILNDGTEVSFHWQNDGWDIAVDINGKGYTDINP